MTDTYVENVLIEKFKELDGLEKVNIGTDDEPVWDYPEVVFPNEEKELTSDYWYELYFIPSTPTQIELGTTARSRWIGILQINVCVPLNDGITPLNERFDNIASLFRSGLYVDGVRILKTYRSSARKDESCYTMPVTVAWQVDLDR